MDVRVGLWRKLSTEELGNAFELWCWRRLLRVPWTARRSNQSILKEISPEYSLEGLTLKLKLQYFGHMMQRANSLEKTLMLEKIEGRRRRGWMTLPTQWTWVWVNSGSWWWTGRPGVLRFMGSQSVWYDWVTELNWAALCSRNSLGVASGMQVDKEHWMFPPAAVPVCWRGNFIPDEDRKRRILSTNKNQSSYILGWESDKYLT